MSTNEHSLGASGIRRIASDGHSTLVVDGGRCFLWVQQGRESMGRDSFADSTWWEVPALLMSLPRTSR